MFAVPVEPDEPVPETVPIKVLFAPVFQYPANLPIETLLEKFTIGAEFSANIPPIQMEVGEPARLVLLSTKGKTLVEQSSWLSRGKNTPFFNTELNGTVTPLFD